MKINPLLSLFIVQNQSFKDYFRIMKISLFLLFACALQLLAVNTEAQNAVITFPSNSISRSANRRDRKADRLLSCI